VTPIPKSVPMLLLFLNQETVIVPLVLSYSLYSTAASVLFLNKDGCLVPLVLSIINLDCGTVPHCLSFVLSGLQYGTAGYTGLIGIDVSFC
jgi:hypothetical protein